MNKEELATILGEHRKWFADNTKGKCANLQGADLRYANLWGADLRGADLRDANLQNADLRGANLQNADLRGADLRYADLRGTDLRDANLQNADLRGANLRGADLRGADLQNANLQNADLDFSSGIPLHCGAFDFKADRRLAAQLAYHFCRIDFGDNEEVRKAQAALRTLANTSHLISGHKCAEIAKGGE